MNKFLLALLLASTFPVLAVQPSTVTIVKDPLTVVKIIRNRTNTSKQITITANPQDIINATNIAPPRPTGAIAGEGESFTISGGSYTVSYGAGTALFARELPAGTYTCGNELFGDPAVGVVKYCFKGALVPPPVVVVVPPVMHGGIHVDETTVPKFYPGINTVLLTAPGPIPPARTDDWEADGKWRFVCNTIAFNFDDPIVYPGRPGVAHGHNYFGNGQIDASTTPANIRDGDKYTSCRGGTINLSAYWTPALVDTRTGAYVLPKANLGYYSTGFWRYDNNNPPINPMPKGLVMIAGTATASGPGGYAGGMSCLTVALGYDRPGTKTDGSVPTNCVPGEDELWAVIKFPQCWDGVNLDSPNHKDHMAFPVPNTTSTWSPARQYTCPASHPKWVPELSYHVEYLIPSVEALKAWKFVSDTGVAGYGFHADYMNGWDQAIMDAMTTFCLTGQRNCGTAILPDGRTTLEFQGN